MTTCDLLLVGETAFTASLARELDASIRTVLVDDSCIPLRFDGSRIQHACCSIPGPAPALPGGQILTDSCRCDIIAPRHVVRMLLEEEAGIAADRIATIESQGIALPYLRSRVIGTMTRDLAGNMRNALVEDALNLRHTHLIRRSLLGTGPAADTVVACLRGLFAPGEPAQTGYENYLLVSMLCADAGVTADDRSMPASTERLSGRPVTAIRPDGAGWEVRLGGDSVRTRQLAIGIAPHILTMAGIEHPFPVDYAASYWHVGLPGIEMPVGLAARAAYHDGGDTLVVSSGAEGTGFYFAAALDSTPDCGLVRRFLRKFAPYVPRDIPLDPAPHATPSYGRKPARKRLAKTVHFLKNYACPSCGIDGELAYNGMIARKLWKSCSS